MTIITIQSSLTKLQTQAATKRTNFQRRASREEASSQARNALGPEQRSQLQRCLPRQHTTEDACSAEPHAQEHSRPVKKRECRREDCQRSGCTERRAESYHCSHLCGEGTSRSLDFLSGLGARRATARHRDVFYLFFNLIHEGL